MHTTTDRELSQSEIEAIVGGMAPRLDPYVPPGSPGPTYPLPPFPEPIVV